MPRVPGLFSDRVADGRRAVGDRVAGGPGVVLEHGRGVRGLLALGVRASRQGECGTCGRGEEGYFHGKYPTTVARARQPAVPIVVTFGQTSPNASRSAAHLRTADPLYPGR